jgi:hypothetical protein
MSASVWTCRNTAKKVTIGHIKHFPCEPDEAGDVGFLEVQASVWIYEESALVSR